jgi:hypothetical protein
MGGFVNQLRNTLDGSLLPYAGALAGLATEPRFDSNATNGSRRGQGSERRLAVGADRSGQRSLDPRSLGCSRIARGRYQINRIIALTTLKGDDALARRRQAGIGGNQLGDAVEAPQASEACRGEDDGIVLSSIDLVEPSVDVAAYVDKIEVWAVSTQLSNPSLAAGADTASRFKRSERTPTRRHQSIPRILPGQERRQCEASRFNRGQVLQAVHGRVRAAIQERCLKAANERRLVSEPAQRDIRPLVGLAADGHDLDIDAGIERPQALDHQARLRQRQGAGPGR